MARIKIQDIRENIGVKTTYDLANAIVADTSFKDYALLADATNVIAFGDAIMMNKQLQNEFVTALVERIGLVVLRNKLMNNPLAFMKKGALGYGRTIEEVFTDLAQAQRYNPEDSESTLFKRTIPNVKVLFHEMNRQELYPVTVQDESLKTAFTSWEKLDEFILSILNSMYSAAEVDEYRYMMLLLENYYAKSHFKIVASPELTSADNAKAFTKLVREHGTIMTMPQGSREYNSLAVHTRSEPDELYLIITAKAKASLDVDVLASAFNLNPAQTIGKTIVIDRFAKPEIQALLVDESFFMVYDKNQQMTSQYNGKGLYTNYFYHIWQVMSTSRFANAIAFVSGALEKVTEVIVSPTVQALKAGRQQQFTAYIRQTDTVKYTPAWTITGINGTTVASGTTVSATGLVTLGATQVGELSVKATVTYDTSKTTVGEAIVTVTQ